MNRRDVLRLLVALGAYPAGEALAGRRSRREQDRESEKHATKSPWKPGRQLVVVLLQGGPDGLSMVAPTADPFYPFLRPTTALAPDSGGCDLGEGFFLHPAMGALAPYYAKKQLGVVVACAMPGVAPSHKAALADFARGTPVQSGRSRGGWLGRLALALDGEKTQMLVATPSPVYEGAPHYNMIAPGRGPSLPGIIVEDQALYDAAARLYAGKEPLAKPFGAGREARQDLLAKLIEESRAAAAGAIPAPAFPDYAERFAKDLAKRRDAALAFLAVGGFDTHSGQGAAKGYLADRFQETAKGLDALAQGLGKAFDDTVIVALGEFGRSARENQFGGTDNGLGGVMLVLGGPVAGGKVHGRWPGLAAHRLADGRNLAAATDWRDVVGGIAVGHLGLPEKALGGIFPGFTPANPPVPILGS